jgi:arabinogalactan endo-1,4-beta-galactosidase
MQIGNEINGGMLWPEGALATYNWQSFAELAELLKQGVQAVNDCSPETKIMLHLAEAGNYGLLNWWYGNIIAEGVPFDIMGLSYYPFWHGTLENLQDTLNNVATQFDKDIIIVEFAYPFTLDNDDFLENIVRDPSLLTTGYPATPEGQRVMTRKVMNIISEIPDGHGLGVFYWDATWTAVDGNGWDPTDPSSGNGWENQALFDFDGKALPALLEFEGKRSHSSSGTGDK